MLVDITADLVVQVIKVIQIVIVLTLNTFTWRIKCKYILFFILFKQYTGNHIILH